MRFIMTGHRGLIGSALLERLKKEGHKPVLLIDKQEGEEIIDIEKHRLTTNVDVMIHMASFNKINKCVENPEIPFKEIALGTFKVFEFCRKNKIPKVIYFSSSRIIEEEKNAYTSAKIFGEELCKAYFQCYGIKYLIIRPSTVYGPNDLYTKRLVPEFIRKALKGENLEIYGDESKTLDFTYLDDFIDGFLLAMNQENKEYSFGTGKATRVSYVADLIIKLAGKGKKVFSSPEKAQPQHVELDITDMEKLGYQPKIVIEEGIAKTFEWFKKYYYEN